MANTRFQHKRSTVSGVTPTTSDIAAGELGLNLADRRIFTSNGSAVFELGSNLTNVAVSGNVTIGSTGDVVFTPGAGIFANGSVGTAGQVLHSNGSSVYWDTDDQGVTSVATGVGLTGGPITTTGTVSVLANNGITANSTGLFVTQGTGAVVNSTGVHVNSSFIGTLTANNANNFNGQPASFYTNASNITTGTLPMAQLGSNVVNTTAAFTISGIHTHTANIHTGNSTVNTQQSNAIIVINNSNTATLNASSISFGNATVNSVYGLATVTINGATIANSTGANNAFNLGGVAAASYVNTSGAYTISGIHTHTANIVMGNSTVNSQYSNSVILISNSTSTTTLGLADLRIGNTTTNVIISNAVSTFGGNVVITGSANAANVTAALFTGNLTGTASNATNLNSQPGSFYTNATNLATGTVPTARLGSGTANSTTFLGGDQTYKTAVTSVATGSGLTGGPITTTGTVSVLANNGITANATGLYVTQGTGAVVNATGVHVNAAYIATLDSNNATNFGGLSLATVQSQISGNAATAYANAVANAAALYQTTAGLSANVATLNSNNATNLNGQAASFYTNATNLATGTVPTARLGSGTANSSTFLRGDQTWAAAGGSLAGGELFNINVSAAVGYAITTSMAAAFTAPATAGLEYVVHSIQVTNIGTANASVSGEFSGTTYSSISYALTVPVPRESAVELLKMPKVMQPSDILRLQADQNSTLHAYITYETITSTAYFGAGVDVTADATFTDLHTATGNSVITSVLLANDDGVNDVKARVVWTDGTNAIQGYLCFDLIVPADATVELLEKVKYLPSGHKIRVLANVGNRLEAIIAGKVL